MLEMTIFQEIRLVPVFNGRITSAGRRQGVIAGDNGVQFGTFDQFDQLVRAENCGGVDGDKYVVFLVTEGFLRFAEEDVGAYRFQTGGAVAQQYFVPVGF